MTTLKRLNKKILMIVNEPSPYMDIWFNGIAQKNELTVIYTAEVNAGHPWKTFKGFGGIFSSDMSLNELRKKVKECDLVIAGGWIRIYPFMAMMFGFLYHKTTIMTTDHPFHPKKWVSLFKRLFLYRKLDYIFCATEETCASIIKTYGKVVEGKTRFFPYGIDTEVKISTKKHQIDRIDVLVATNFLPRKGHSVLFEALKMLDKEDERIKSKYHFTFVGKGDELGKCQTIARELSIDTKFLGWVENEEYHRLMDETDVYIHPSIEEPFGIPPVDAMCKGKVVIVCDGVMSLRGLIRQGENGFHYSSPVENNNASVELYSILIGLDSEKFEYIGKQAREDAIKKFSFTQFVDMIEDLCKIEKAIKN